MVVWVTGLHSSAFTCFRDVGGSTCSEILFLLILWHFMVQIRHPNPKQIWNLLCFKSIDRVYVCFVCIFTEKTWVKCCELLSYQLISVNGSLKSFIYWSTMSYYNGWVNFLIFFIFVYWFLIEKGLSSKCQRAHSWRQSTQRIGMLCSVFSHNIKNDSFLVMKNCKQLLFSIITF